MKLIAASSLPSFLTDLQRHAMDADAGGVIPTISWPELTTVRRAL